MALLEESGQGDVLMILEEHEALLWGGEIDAAANHFLPDAVVAALGIVAERGKSRARRKGFILAKE